jgi:large subunit ribosomal protein L23
MTDPYKVVHTVLITEKATEQADELGQYSFRVDRNANKVQIREAVEQLFDVKVGSVNVMNRQGKRKRLRNRQFGKRADWKKAVVTLTEGEIEII